MSTKNRKPNLTDQLVEARADVVSLTSRLSLADNRVKKLEADLAASESARLEADKEADEWESKCDVLAKATEETKTFFDAQLKRNAQSIENYAQSYNMACEQTAVAEDKLGFWRIGAVLAIFGMLIEGLILCVRS